MGPQLLGESPSKFFGQSGRFMALPEPSQTHRNVSQCDSRIRIFFRSRWNMLLDEPQNLAMLLCCAWSRQPFHNAAKLRVVTSV